LRDAAHWLVAEPTEPEQMGLAQTSLPELSTSVHLSASRSHYRWLRQLLDEVGLSH